MKSKSSCRRNAAKWFMFVFIASYLTLLTSCANQVAVVQKTVVDDKPAYFKDLEAATQHLSNSLSRQLSDKVTESIPQMVVDVFFNEQSAEVSSAGKGLQTRMIELLKRGTPPFPSLPLGGASLQKSRWVVIGSYKLEPQSSTTATRWVKISTETKEIQTDTVLAKAEAFVDAQQFRTNEPLRFYKDAPMYMTSVRKSSKATPQTLAERLAIDAKLADARNLYDSGDYSGAERLFSEVNASTKGINMVALSGLYQSQFRLNHLAEAEASFGRLVLAGLETGNLSVKFLFKVNSTDFLPNSELAGQYPLWLRQIAQQLSTQDKCLAVNGHASKSGSAELNERLSRQRAERIVLQLRRAKPELNGRLQAVGKGFKENIVGTGTNDALDAIDRRVDFELTACR